MSLVSMKLQIRHKCTLLNLPLDLLLFDSLLSSLNRKKLSEKRKRLTQLRFR